MMGKIDERTSRKVSLEICKSLEAGADCKASSKTVQWGAVTAASSMCAPHAWL
jgi:hypothetical protein